MKPTGIIFLAAAILAIHFSTGFALSEEEEFSVIQGCEQQAKQYFSNTFGERLKKKHDVAFESHFNKKLSRCFLLIKEFDKRGSISHAFIYDLGDHNILQTCSAGSYKPRDKDGTLLYPDQKFLPDSACAYWQDHDIYSLMSD